MILKTRNKFRVIHPQSLNYQQQMALAELYLPLMGQQAYALYHLLNAEGGFNGEVNSISRLIKILDTDIDKINESFRLLEQFRLIRTFYNKNTDMLHFEIQFPMNGSDFLMQAAFGRFFIKKMGKQQYNQTSSLFQVKELSEDDLEVTSNFDISVLADWDDDSERSFEELKKKLYDTTYIEFDIKEFLNGYSMLRMPGELRTAENLKIIAQMGSVYSIDIPTMRKIVAQSIDTDTMTLDQEALRKRCLAAKSKGNENSLDEYDINSVQYLYNLKGQYEVDPWEKKMLEEISLEYHLSRDVINYMLRYVYDNHDKRISTNLAKAVAKDWTLHGISTIEQAQEYVSSLNKKSVRSKLPDFSLKKKQASDKLSMDEIRSQIFKEEK
ncbi:MAG: DnaD domain protein [Erysipelotrichaceae bacterium]|nr:DnaD domain protein [Erysipelotrichaceae bacterium]